MAVIMNSYLQKNTNFDNTLQVTNQPDGSFLCFGGSHDTKETSSIETPVVDVSKN